MARSLLDEKLLQKIAEKRGKDILKVRKNVSAYSAKHHISPEAALVLIAKGHGIGTAVYERGRSASVRDEIRNSGLNVAPKTTTKIIRTQNIQRTKIRPWWEHPLFIAFYSVVILGLLATFISHELGWIH